MTVRHALLPVGALLVLGLGVYLFVEVRAQSSPPAVVPASTRDRVRPPRSPSEARVQQPTAPPNAATGAVQRTPPPVRADVTPLPREAAAMQEPPAALTGGKLDAAMDDANKAYDRGDFEDAKQLAGRVLAQNPTNVRMLRIMVSASCIDGDGAAAQLHYARLPAQDQEQMRIRCARYGVAFGDK